MSGKLKEENVESTKKFKFCAVVADAQGELNRLLKDGWKQIGIFSPTGPSSTKVEVRRIVHSGHTAILLVMPQ